MLRFCSNDDEATTAQSTGNITAGDCVLIVLLSENSPSCERVDTSDGIELEPLADNTKQKSSTDGLSYKELLSKEEIENTITMEDLLVSDSDAIVDRKVTPIPGIKSKYLHARKEVISGCQVFINLIK